MILGYTWFELIVLAVSILIAMSVHEAVHAYVGYMLGDTTAAEQGRLSLNPLRHVDPYMTVLLPLVTLVLFQAPILAARPVPFDPRRVRFDELGAAMIALAGPISNLVLAVIGAFLLRFSGDNTSVGGALYIFMSLNVSLFIFNLVPIPPLDGSRVLYAFAPESIQDFMRRLEPFGLTIIFMLVLLGGFGGILNNLNHAVLDPLFRLGLGV